MKNIIVEKIEGKRRRERPKMPFSVQMKEVTVSSYYEFNERAMDLEEWWKPYRQEQGS